MRAYKFFLGLLAVINITPVLAPLLWAARETIPIFGSIGKLIYLVYSFTCHQFAYRSFYLFDYQWAWCARDVGIWAGFLAAAIATLHPKIKGIAWYWIIPFAIPIALDGGIQTIATLVGVGPNFYGIESDIAYLSNNLTRFVTGSIFGIGVGLWMAPKLKEALTNQKVVERLTKRFKTRIAVFFVIAFTLLYFLIMVSWSFTSPKVQPINALDSLPKLPATNIFIRRQHGACPTDLENLLALDCFF